MFYQVLVYSLWSQMQTGRYCIENDEICISYSIMRKKIINIVLEREMGKLFWNNIFLLGVVNLCPKDTS